MCSSSLAWLAINSERGNVVARQAELDTVETGVDVRYSAVESLNYSVSAADYMATALATHASITAANLDL